MRKNFLQIGEGKGAACCHLQKTLPTFAHGKYAAAYICYRACMGKGQQPVSYFRIEEYDIHHLMFATLRSTATGRDRVMYKSKNPDKSRDFSCVMQI